MSKNNVASGLSLEFIAPSGGVVGGAPVIIGNLLVLPAVTVAQTVPFIGDVNGVWDLDAVSGDTGDAGDLVYWDDGAKKITTTVGSNKLVGAYAEVKVNGVSVVKVRMNGITFA